MKLYYYAEQIFQFSYCLPLYRQVGGTFIVKKPKRYLRFKQYLRNMNALPDKSNFFNTPQVMIRDRRELLGLEGVILSLSDVRLACDDGKCTRIYIGHGTGDKRYGAFLDVLESYDYHFLSGPKHLEKQKDMGLTLPEKKLVKIGNMRFDDYLSRRIDREMVLDNLGVVDRTRKTVLYAPTWRYGGGTYKKYVYEFCKTLTSRYNLIVRPHHFDAQHLPFMKIWALLKGIRHVYFSNPSCLNRHDTMNDFAVSDILISDTSSVIYEYLVTGKPIVVVDTKCEDLHRVPDEMNVAGYVDHYDGSGSLLDLVERNLEEQPFQKDYARLLEKCFYFNDGCSTERAVRFLEALPSVD